MITGGMECSWMFKIKIDNARDVSNSKDGLRTIMLQLFKPKKWNAGEFTISKATMKCDVSNSNGGMLAIPSPTIPDHP